MRWISFDAMRKIVCNQLRDTIDFMKDLNVIWFTIRRQLPLSEFRKRLESLSAFGSSCPLCTEAFAFNGLPLNQGQQLQMKQSETLLLSGIGSDQLSVNHTNHSGKFCFSWGLFLFFPLSFFSLVAFPFPSFGITMNPLYV